MKTHLTWIRVTAAVVVAGVSVQQAAAQYAPYRPQQAAAPAAAPQTAYQPTPQQAQPVYTAYRTPGAPTTSYGSPTGSQYTQPTAAYPQSPQASSPYPQTTSQYPATYGAYPYVAQQAAETIPAPKNMNQSAAQPTPTPMNGAPANGTMNGGMPADNMSAAQPGGCNCTTPYGAGSYYNAQGTGCTAGGYPNCDLSNYMGNDCGPENQWFGGIYFIDMGRTNQSDVSLTTRVDHNVAPNPYYPPKSRDFISTIDIDSDFRPGVEVRVGSTFTIGESCSACQGGMGGYGYGCNGCNSGCNSCNCSSGTTYAWEVAWWGLDDDCNQFVQSDDINSNVRIYGMKNFGGLEYDRDGAGGAYGYRPVNDYYGYQMPIPTPPAPSGNYTAVLAQRAYSDYKAQNLELNIIRFPACETCSGGCDACGGCDAPLLTFTAYGSCGVRYFHIDDTFAYDTEFAEWGGGAYDHPTYDGFTYDNSNELCYDIEVKNDLVGPQVGWTMNYGYGCRCNFFVNSTFGIFENHMDQVQRMWSGGGGTIRFAGTGESFNVHSTKDDVAFLGELRVGAAYDVTCHWRGVLAYRAVALTGIATSTGQIPDNFSSRAEVAQINSDNSSIIHGVQVGAECRY